MNTIQTLHMSHLRNAEHVQLMTEFKELIEQSATIKAKTSKIFALFVQLFEREDECMLVIQKSYLTNRIQELDRQRKIIFRGMTNAVLSAAHHFNTQKSEAAQQIKVLLEGYGNLSRKTYDEETAGITNLVQDLEGAYATQVSAIGIGEWVAEILRKNIDFETLIQLRDRESAAKPKDTMVNIRRKIDEEYRKIIQAIESFAALAESEQEFAEYSSFIKSLNAVNFRYKDRLAIRKGKARRQIKADLGEKY